jgi:AhpD family alkylhydroperoxidase
MDHAMRSNRTQLDKTDAAAHRALADLSVSVQKSAAAADIQPGLMELIRLRVSQINNCAFCVRTHARDALAAGESTDRIAVVSHWRETAYFSDRERAALELAEAVTTVNHSPIPQGVYDRVAETLNEQEISAVSWITIVMNSFNRVWVTSGRPVLPT